MFAGQVGEKSIYRDVMTNGSDLSVRSPAKTKAGRLLFIHFSKQTQGSKIEYQSSI